MNNFIFENKTKVYFGKGCVNEYLANEILRYGHHVLLAYGGGSIKQNGRYQEILSILNRENVMVTEFLGIMPN